MIDDRMLILSDLLALFLTRLGCVWILLVVIREKLTTLSQALHAWRHNVNIENGKRRD